MCSLLTVMNSFLEAIWLNTSCLWEKWSPPSFQLTFTAPLNSWSSKRLANCFVKVYNRTHSTLISTFFLTESSTPKYWYTLMLSTSEPGGGSCRAMVSDVSIVKYTSMGHSFFSTRNTNIFLLKTPINTTILQLMWYYHSNSVACHSLLHSGAWPWLSAPKRRQRAMTSNLNIFSCPVHQDTDIRC